MIEIKDKERFEEEVIPTFSKGTFVTFVRQMNKHGFSKIPSRNLRRDDDDSNTPPSSPSLSVVTFHNENFKRDEPDLMENITIKRSTNHTGGSNPPNDVMQAEIEGLKRQISVMQENVEKMQKEFAALIVRMKEDFQRRIEQMTICCGQGSPSVVTFHNEYFKRDDPDLMRNIKRSTKHTGGSNPPNDQQAEIEGLKHQISVMQGDMEDMEKQFGAHIVRMEEDFQRRIEQMTKDFAAGKAQSNRPNPSPKQPVGGFKQFEQPWENRRMEVESVKIEKNVKKNP